MASGGLAGYLERHDPTRYAVHRGIRAALAVTVALPLSRLLVDDAQFTLFAAFGSLSLIIFVDFPGNRQARTASYLLLGFIGMILITLGTLASGAGWIAVLAMAVVGFAILFAGVLSAAAAAAGRAALLAFVLPVTVPVSVGELLPRLGGWGLGMLIAIPLALFAWPPREHHELRAGVSRGCRALAGLVAALGGPPANEDAVEQALGDLRRKFRASVSRPVGLSAGGRLLARVTHDLDWLSVEARSAAAAGRIWSAHGAPRDVAPPVTEACARVLTAASDALDQPTRASRDELGTRLGALTTARTVALDRWLTEALASRPQADLPVVERLHSLAYATELAGRHIAAALAADARSPLDKILGRDSGFVMPGQVPGSVQAGTRLARHHLSWHSVWLHNSLRGGLGMALAVLLAQVTEVSHGFWVALGAMSVLRSSALNTGATAFRALAGTMVGVVVGAGVLILLNGSPVAWVILPFAMFLAGFANDAISFAAGQAAFSIAVLIMFSLLAPGGWQVGLVRLEDVAIGAGAALVVGLLLWPRGAGGAIRRAIADALRENAQLLVNSIQRLTKMAQSTADTGQSSVVDRMEVLGAAFRLDDALRQYLADRGAKSAAIEDLVAVCVGSEKVRLTTEALAELADRTDPPDARSDRTRGARPALRPAGGRSRSHWPPTSATVRIIRRTGWRPSRRN